MPQVKIRKKADYNSYNLIFNFLIFSNKHDQIVITEASKGDGHKKVYPNHIL